MDSILDEDPTLPVDFDQTSNFSRFLAQARKLEKADSGQNETTVSEVNDTRGFMPLRTSKSASDAIPERPISRGTTMREYEHAISELKKENFGLKMRIYYMEQRMHDVFDADTEGIVKANIELKVTLEQMKSDINEKTVLLSQALAAMEQMAEDHSKQNNKENVQLKDALKRLEQELSNSKKSVADLKLKLDQAEEIASKSDEQDRAEKKELNNVKILLEEKQKEIRKLNACIDSKERDYKALQVQKQGDEESLKSMVLELEQALANKDRSIELLRKDLEQIATSPERSMQHYKALYERCSKDIVELKSELASKLSLIEGLKEHVVNTDKTNKTLRSTLHDKEMEQLRTVIPLEEKAKQLDASLREHKTMLDRKNDEILRVKEDLSKAVLKLQESEQSAQILLQDKDKEIFFLNDRKVQQETESHLALAEQSKEIKLVGDQLRLLKLEKKELQNHCSKLEQVLRQQLRVKDTVIARLSRVASDKNVLTANLVDTQDSAFKEINVGEDVSSMSVMVERLTSKLQEQDKDLEKCVEDHVHAMQSKEKEIGSLRKNQDQLNLERQDLLLQLNSQIDAVNLLEKASLDKVAIISDLKSALEKEIGNHQSLASASAKDRQVQADIIDDLTKLLSKRDEDVQMLQGMLKSRAVVNSPASETVDDNVQSQIAMLEGKVDELEQFIKDLVSERDNLIVANDSKVRHLSLALKDRDTHLKELTKKLVKCRDDKLSAIQDLAQQVEHADSEILLLKSSVKKLEDGHETEKKLFQTNIDEKDNIIEMLTKNGQEKDKLLAELRNAPRSLSSETLKADMEESKQQLIDSREKLSAAERAVQELSDVKNKLQRELDMAVLSRQALQGQLEDALNINNKLSQRLQDVSPTSEVKKNKCQEDLERDLLEAICFTKEQKQKYENVVNGFENNDDLKSQVKMLNYALAEVESLQGRIRARLWMKSENAQPFQSHLAMLPEESGGQLQDAELISSLTNELASLRAENESLKDDVKRCESEARAVDEGRNRLQLEYEYLVHERDREISSLTDKARLAQESVILLTSQVSKTAEELTNCKQQLGAHKLQLQELKVSQLVSRDKLIVEKADLISALQKSIAAKEGLLTDGQVQLQSLQQQVELLQRTLSEAQAREASLEKDLKLAKSETTSIQGVASACAEEFHTASEQISSLDTKLKLLDSSCQENNLLTKDLEKLAKVNEHLQGHIREISTSFNHLTMEKDSEALQLHDQLEKSKQQVSDLKNDLSSRKLSCNQLQIEVESLRGLASDVEILRDQLKSSYNLNGVLQRQVKDLVKTGELRNQVLVPELNQLRLEIADLRYANRELESQILHADDSKHELLELKTMLADLTLKNSELDSTVRALDKEVESLKGESEKLREECRRCKDEARRAQINLDHLQLENASVKSQLTSARIDQDEVQRLHSEIENLRQRKVALEKQLLELGESAAKLKRQLSVTQDDNEVKESRITSLEKEIESLEERLELFAPVQTSSRNDLNISVNVVGTQTEGVPVTMPKPNDESLIRLHIKEMQELRKQLAETIRNNDALKRQLEERLSQIERDASQIGDPALKISLVRDNDRLRGRAIEDEATINQMKTHVDVLLKEKSSDKRTISDLHAQIHELNELTRNLKLEFSVYDRLVRQLGLDEKERLRIISRPGSSASSLNTSDLFRHDEFDKTLLAALMKEIHELREQLAQSMEVNMALKERLEEQLGRPVSISPVLLPTVASAKRSLFSTVVQSVSVSSLSEKPESLRNPSPDETPTKDCGTGPLLMSSASKAFQTVPGDLVYFSAEDWKVARQTLKDALSILQEVEKLALYRKGEKNETFLRSIDVRALIDLVVRCLRLLERKSVVELNTADKQHVPLMLQQDNFKLSKEVRDLNLENGKLKSDIARLKQRVASQDEMMKSTLRMMEANVSSKEIWEKEIASHLSKTRDTLKATKGNLQVRVLKEKERLDKSQDSDHSMKDSDESNIVKHADTDLDSSKAISLSVT